MVLEAAISERDEALVNHNIRHFVETCARFALETPSPGTLLAKQYLRATAQGGIGPAARLLHRHSTPVPRESIAWTMREPLHTGLQTD